MDNENVVTDETQELKEAMVEASESEHQPEDQAQEAVDEINLEEGEEYQPEDLPSGVSLCINKDGNVALRVDTTGWLEMTIGQWETMFNKVNDYLGD